MNITELFSFAEFLTPAVLKVLGCIFGLLIVLTIAFWIARAIKGPNKLVNELLTRTYSWWVILIVFTATIFISRLVAVISLAYLSFVAFRELSSNLNLRLSDRRSLLWCYFAVIPFQFMTAYIGWYGMFIIFIPVVMFVGLNMISVVGGNTKGITASMGIIHWSAMLTIFSLSHMAYMLSFPEVAGYEAGNGGMVLWLVLITSLNDVFQFTWGKTLGKTKVLPSVSPNKTLEGLIGGMLTTSLLGWLLHDLLPIGPYKAALLALMLAFCGFMGDVTVSAVKRDLGLKDMGSSIPGHGGIMDRIDSLAFNSLVCFHLIRYWSYL